MHQIIQVKKEITKTPTLEKAIRLTEKHEGIFLYTTPNYGYNPCRWIIGLNPIIVHNGQTITLSNTNAKDPQMSMVDQIAQSAKTDPNIPLWLGYIGWDYKNLIEEKGLFKEWKDPNFDYAHLAIYKHIWIVCPESQNATLYTFEIKNHNTNYPLNTEEPICHSNPDCFTVSDLKSNINQKAYINKIEAIQEHIRSGDIYQANMTREVKGNFTGNTSMLAKTLLESNNIEFGAYLCTKQGKIISTSPERFFKIENQTITVSPIKGTLPRGNDKEEDISAQNKLLNDIKNRRELAMIVDLLRNDISKICIPGTVTVENFPTLMILQNVFHLVAHITGEINRSLFTEIINALFPGGSISGCPKIRACQIIDTLEITPRGPYTGSLGYLCSNGNMDFNILIRTVFQYADKIQFNVGGGITLLSDSKEEFDETCHKAKNILSALNATETNIYD